MAMVPSTPEPALHSQAGLNQIRHCPSGPIQTFTDRGSRDCHSNRAAHPFSFPYLRGTVPRMLRFDRQAAAARADTLATEWRTEGGPGGMIILFGRDGLTHAACGGLADLAQGLAITPDTAFRWASITKQFLATLALRVGPGLDEALGRHLPALSPG